MIVCYEGTLAIIDSSGGGTVQITSGKGESTNSMATNMESGGHVIASGGQVSTIVNKDNDGRITISGGLVSRGPVLSGYVISDDSQRGIITLSGGRVDGYIRASAQGQITLTGAAVINGKTSKAPDLTGMAGDYEWRTTQDGTLCAAPRRRIPGAPLIIIWKSRSLKCPTPSG